MSLPSIDPPPPEDASRCQLLGPTALVVQALMGFFVISSLVAKRHFEKRKRPWKIWIWDVGKQLVGQAVLHALNLLISGLVAIDTNNNPCSAYLLNILIDTTIGVLIIYFALKQFTWLFSVYLGKEGYESGQYGIPPQSIYWWRQLVPYLLSVLTMKILVLLPLTLPGISTLLLRFGHAAIEYLSPSVQVVFVMAIFPLIMNVVQFCLIDQVIKAGKDAYDGTYGDDQVGSGMGDEEGGYGRGQYAALLPHRSVSGERGGQERERDSAEIRGKSFELELDDENEDEDEGGDGAKTGRRTLATSETMALESTSSGSTALRGSNEAVFSMSRTSISEAAQREARRSLSPSDGR